MRRLPMAVCGVDPQASVAWSVWTTGPHQPWALRGLYETQRDAMGAASKERQCADLGIDGVVVRRLVLGKVASRWNKPAPRRDGEG